MRVNKLVFVVVMNQLEEQVDLYMKFHAVPACIRIMKDCIYRSAIFAGLLDIAHLECLHVFTLASAVLCLPLPASKDFLPEKLATVSILPRTFSALLEMLCVH